MIRIKTKFPPYKLQLKMKKVQAAKLFAINDQNFYEEVEIME